MSSATEDAALLADRADAAVERLAEAKASIRKSIVGLDEVVEQSLSVLLAGGHGLLVGAPGLAKTRLVHTLAVVTGLDDKRVQFTPDLMPADILGSEVLEEGEDGRRAFRFIPGPVFCKLLMADEINRASPRTQAALLQAMQEGFVTVAGARHDLPKPFHVLATQNPIEQEGTYPLPEAQVDRFMLKLKLTYPDKEEELALRQLAAKEQGVVKVFFRLPQVSEIVGHRHEQRSRNVDIGGIAVPQNYTVRTDVVRNVPVRADVSAFGCVSCNSRERLDFYLIAQAGIESYTPTATDWVRLARAAVDFGESYKAEEYLRVAEDLVAPSQSPVYRARSLEEIGKTYIIMRNSDKGKLLLEQAKSLWRTSKLDSQVGGLHDILVWEAQYASSQGDINTAGQRLAEMSEVVARYDLAESITSRMIHDAHAVCLTLLANKNNFDPALPVPPEYRTYAPAFGGWVSPHQIARTIDLIQIIPVAIETDVMILHDPQPGLMQAELARALELFLGAMDGALPSPESSSPTPPTED
jgi:MoxR-like ATPase